MWEGVYPHGTGEVVHREKSLPVAAVHVVVGQRRGESKKPRPHCCLFLLPHVVVGGRVEFVPVA